MTVMRSGVHVIIRMNTATRTTASRMTIQRKEPVNHQNKKTHEANNNNGKSKNNNQTVMTAARRRGGGFSKNTMGVCLCPSSGAATRRGRAAGYLPGPTPAPPGAGAADRAGFVFP